LETDTVERNAAFPATESKHFVAKKLDGCQLQQDKFMKLTKLPILVPYYTQIGETRNGLFQWDLTIFSEISHSSRLAKLLRDYVVRRAYYTTPHPLPVGPRVNPHGSVFLS